MPGSIYFVVAYYEALLHFDSIDFCAKHMNEMGAFNGGKGYQLGISKNHYNSLFLQIETLLEMAHQRPLPSDLYPVNTQREFEGFL